MRTYTFVSARDCTKIIIVVSEAEPYFHFVKKSKVLPRVVHVFFEPFS